MNRHSTARARTHGIDVAAALGRITTTQGSPKRIKVDNGPEFVSRKLECWASWNHVELDFGRPGKRSANALVKAFTSRFRQECLDQHWFLSLEDAHAKLEAWQNTYNGERPHSTVGCRIPWEGRVKTSDAEATAA